MNRVKQFLLIIFLIVYSSVAYCCSCIGEATLKQELKRSDVVFTGKVISKKVIDTRSPTDTLMQGLKMYVAEYKLQVSSIFKGKVKQDTITIITGVGSGDCGFNFEIGNEYIVYSSFENKYYPQGNTVSKFLYTDICRRTRLATDTAEIKALSKKCKNKKATQ
jgi:hypothetical protein